MPRAAGNIAGDAPDLLSTEANFLGRPEHVQPKSLQDDVSLHDLWPGRMASRGPNCANSAMRCCRRAAQQRAESHLILLERALPQSCRPPRCAHPAQWLILPAAVTPSAPQMRRPSLPYLPQRRADVVDGADAFYRLPLSVFLRCLPCITLLFQVARSACGPSLEPYSALLLLRDLLRQPHSCAANNNTSTTTARRPHDELQ